jgi:hypothetical protein
VGIATGYGLTGQGIKSRWGRDFPHLSSLLHNGYRVFPGGKKRPRRDADPSPPSSAMVMKGWSYTSTPPMGRTSCTEPQCLYKGALYLFFYTLRLELQPSSDRNDRYVVSPFLNSTLSHKRPGFRGDIFNGKCKSTILIFSKISKHFLILRSIHSFSYMYIGLHVQYAMFLSDFNQTWIISKYFPQIH